MAAEACAADSHAARQQLQVLQEQLVKQQAAAQLALKAEAQRVDELTRRAEIAEAQAEHTSTQLARSLTESYAHSQELHRTRLALETGPSSFKAVEGAPSAETMAGNEPMAEVDREAEAAQDLLLRQLRSSAADFDLDLSLQESNSSTVESLPNVVGINGIINSEAPQRVRALSRMRKAELIGECEARGLDVVGTVPELRARLRVERKREALIVDITERGWSEQKARSALEAESWDLDAALSRLIG